MVEKTTADMLKEIAEAPIAKFRGEPWYNVAGDCVMWHFREDESFGDRIDDKLTVYRAFEGREIVGCQVKGVQALLAKLGSFNIEIHTAGVSIALLFCLSHFDASETVDDRSSRKPIYDRLVQRAGNAMVTIPDDNNAVCA